MGHYHGRSKPYHRQYKKRTAGSQSAGRILFGVARALFYPFKKRAAGKALKFRSVKRSYIQKRFLEIEELIKLGSPSNFQKALIEADKLLDFALEGLGYEGEVFAERLRSAKAQLSNYNEVWLAHRLRNQAVHETDVEILSYQTKKAIKSYKQALQDLKVL